MATYYRWRKSTIEFYERESGTVRDIQVPVYTTQTYGGLDSEGYKIVSNLQQIDVNESGQRISLPANSLVSNEDSNIWTWYITKSETTLTSYSAPLADPPYRLTAVPFMTDFVRDRRAGDFIGYVYSTKSSAYPTNGTQYNCWYNNRTTVTSPTAPSGLSYPATITTPSVDVTWTAATSNVPDYPVSGYQVDVSTNGGSSWTLAGNPSTNSLHYNITPGTTSIMFRVRAKDSNGQWGGYVTGTASQVLLAPTLTVPQIAMQGQSIAVNWTAIEGADSYTLQRKSSADADWTQVYSGANTTFSETAGTWTTVQYRVQAVFDGTPGGWATSAEIPVVSASALVISGQDGDLGTLVNDVPYSISTDTGNQITATITVNGAVIFNGNVGNSVADVIPVLDLINGAGTIVIEASVTASSGPVSAVRTWTYTKTMMTFPNAGSIAELTKDGKVMWPETLAEAVRIPGGKTLDQVMGFPAQVYAGSYVGTGTSGQSNPNSLTFPFEPKAVFISDEGTGSGDYRRKSMLAIYKASVGQVIIGAQTTGEVSLTWGQNSLSWYSSSAGNQLNQEGVTAHYVAIG